MGGWTSRRASRILVPLAVLAGCWGVLLWPVQTRQGVNYQVTAHRMPLYLKLAGFLYRDMEYRHLAGEVTRGVRDDEAKLLRLYDWVRAHLTAGIPTMDDHVWNIIIRGYGESDQLADVLATLCAYAGLPAQFVMFGPPGQPSVHALTMAKLHGRWCPIDPYYGVIIRDASGRVASRDEILAHPDLVRRAAPDLAIRGIEYAALLTWLPDPSSATELRPYRQMPLWRAWYVLRHGFQGLFGGAG